MAGNYNITVGGNLGKDAEIDSKSVAGWQILKFSVCTNIRKGSEKVAMWTECAQFFKEGVDIKMAQYLKKGTTVLVNGQPGISGWLDKESKVQVKQECLVNDIVLMGSSDSTGTQTNKTSTLIPPAATAAAPAAQPTPAANPFAAAPNPFAATPANDLFAPPYGKSPF